MYDLHRVVKFYNRILTKYGADRAIKVKSQRNNLKQLVQFCVQIYCQDIHTLEPLV